MPFIGIRYTLQVISMKSMILSIAVALALSVPSYGGTVTDFYISFSGMGVGDAATNTVNNLSIGQTGSAFIWVNDDVSLDTGAFLDISSSAPNVIKFTGGQVFNPDIVISGTSIAVNTRWSVTNRGTISDNFVNELRGFRVITGTGILPSQAANAGGLLVDSLHDISSSAFLFARLDFDVVGSGETTLTIAEGDGLIVNDGVRLNPTFGSAKIQVASVPEPSSSILLSIGSVILCARRWRSKPKSCRSAGSSKGGSPLSGFHA